MSLVLPILCLLLSAAQAQRGGGAPGAFISATTAPFGGTLEVAVGHPRASFGLAFLSLSDGPGPVSDPFFGTLWLDITSTAFGVLPLPLDGAGRASLQIPVGFDQTLFSGPPIYANAFVAGPFLPAPGWSLSRTIRIQFDTIDGWRPAGVMRESRSNHTATLLANDTNDNVSEVFVAGGHLGSIINQVPRATTEIWSPMLRSFRPGPTMALPRTAHGAVKLLNGFVLICGGITSGGVATDRVELFDPIFESLVSIAPMNAPRAGHRVTLLKDGRVLVTGGITSWQNAANAFVQVLNTAQDTYEIFDPMTGTWTPGSSLMNSKRFGHTHTELSDGRILIAGGVSGGAFAPALVTTVAPGQVPVHTNRCEIFDPLTDQLSAAPSLTISRGFHGASLLPDGRVLVTGGSVTGSPQSGSLGPGPGVTTASCEIFDGNAWLQTGLLSTPTAFHTQLRSRWNGDAIIFGGFNGDFTQLQGTSLAVRHNGFVSGRTLPIGVHTLISGSSAVTRANHTTTELQDGSYLLLGGESFPETFAEAWTIVEPQ